MIKRSFLHSNVRQYYANIGTRRGIFVVSSERRQSRHRSPKEQKKEILDRFLSIEEEKRVRNGEMDYKRKLEELQQLTSSVASMINRSKDNVKPSVSRSDSSETDKEVQQIYKTLEEPRDQTNSVEKSLELSSSDKKEFIPPKHSLFIPAIQVPKSITNRLGLALRYLVSKDKQNWELVIKQLRDAGGFKGIPKIDVRQFIHQIPARHIERVIFPISHMLEEAGINKNTKVVNKFIMGLSYGDKVSDEAMRNINALCDMLRKKNKGNLSRDTTELVITAYGKRGELEKIEQMLVEMKSLGLTPSGAALTNVLSTCVYKAKDHNQAVQIFDSIKFISQSTKPGAKAYQDIIVSYVNNNDIEKALDLYQEMIENGVQLNQKVLIALARGCAGRASLKMKAWDFVFDIYKHGWEPSLETFEYILYVSAKEGDVALTRALFYKLSKSKSITPRSFAFLLLAYSRRSSRNEASVIDTPSITFHEQGRIFRKNILQDHEVMGHDNDMKHKIPLLPVLDLTSKKELIAESTAVWSHANIYNPELINSESMNTYLNIFAELGTLSEFKERFDEVSYLDRTGLPHSDQIIIEEPDEVDFTHNTEQVSFGNIDAAYENDNKGSVSGLNAQGMEKKTIKTKRSSISYTIALKAAGHTRNFKFAQRIWSERGLFRKTSQFKKLSRKQKDKLDFEFAAAMVKCLTDMKLLDDAIAILLSTEYQFRWSWRELDGLHKACIKVGDEKSSNAIRGIVRRAQINFEGKIRKKDYKRYVMERGF